MGRLRVHAQTNIKARRQAGVWPNTDARPSWAGLIVHMDRLRVHAQKKGMTGKR